LYNKVASCGVTSEKANPW